MSAREVKVVIDVDATDFLAALARVGRVGREARAAFRCSARAFYRLGDTAGDRHIERIMRDSAARRLPVDVTARRLMVASDIAQVLDGRWQR